MGGNGSKRKKSADDSKKRFKRSSSNDNRERDADITNAVATAVAANGTPPAKNTSAELSGKQKKLSRRPPSRSKIENDMDYRCLMLFPTSGHMGFDIIKVSDELPPIETVREMIAYETRLRLSEPIQELMELYHTDESALTLIHNLLQQHVVEHFGYHHVNALRTALHRFPDEPAIKEAFYVKYNKVTQGFVNQGQCARDVDLFTIDGCPTTLFSQISAGQPLVVLAGSTS